MNASFSRPVRHTGYARPTGAPGERPATSAAANPSHAALRDYEPAPVFLDRSENALRTIEYGARLRGDLYALPLQGASFDRIFCIGVLHHLPERAPVWREIARVLRPGGRLVLGVYAPGSLQSRLRRLYRRTPPPPGAGSCSGHRDAGGHATSVATTARRGAADATSSRCRRPVHPGRGLRTRSGGRRATARRATRLAGMNILVFERT
jgi:SAM-dependent methyltransferase